MATVAGKIGDAEDGNMLVRLIAIENIIVALLADVLDSQSERVREMARYNPARGQHPASPHDRGCAQHAGHLGARCSFQGDEL